MALSSTEVQYAGNGEVYVGPVGTAMPATTAAALNASFRGLGYTNPDGVTITPTTDTNEINAWQSFYPIDRRVTARSLDISFTLMQVNDRNIILNFGGGTVAAATTDWLYTPGAPETLDYRALVVHLVNGTIITRILVPKVMVSTPGALQYRRTDPVELGITLSLVTTGSGDPYNILTSDAAFDPSLPATG